MQILLHSPLFVLKTKTKKWNLNLNNYRNSHYLTLNVVKKNFKEEVYAQLKEIEPIQTPVKIIYKVFPPDKRLFDISNVCSIVDKFFCDALTEANVIPDDNYTVVKEVVYQMGEIDRSNPRCEITIQSIIQ